MDETVYQNIAGYKAVQNCFQALFGHSIRMLHIDVVSARARPLYRFIFA